MSHVYLFGGGGFQLQSEDLQSCQRGVEWEGGGLGGGEVPEGGGKSSHAMQRRRGQLQNTCRVLFGKQMKMQGEVPPSSRVVLRILRNTRAGSRIVLRILRVTRARVETAGTDKKLCFSFLRVLIVRFLPSGSGAIGAIVWIIFMY